MSEILKKAGLLGLGIISLTEKKAKEIGEQLVKQGEASRKEAQAFSRDLLKKADASRKELKKEIENISQALLGKMNLATKKDLADLEKKLRASMKKGKKPSAKKKA